MKKSIQKIFFLYYKFPLLIIIQYMIISGLINYSLWHNFENNHMGIINYMMEPEQNIPPREPTLISSPITKEPGHKEALANIHTKLNGLLSEKEPQTPQIFLEPIKIIKEGTNEHLRNKAINIQTPSNIQLEPLDQMLGEAEHHEESLKKNRRNLEKLLFWVKLHNTIIKNLGTGLAIIGILGGIYMKFFHISKIISPIKTIIQPAVTDTIDHAKINFVQTAAKAIPNSSAIIQTITSLSLTSIILKHGAKYMNVILKVFKK